MISSANCLLLGLALRFAVIAYGEWHDRHFHVPFTDVDYKVFTDAARHVAEGGSPYDRHTYRYPPVLAWLLVPNVLLLASWGKIFFSLVDAVVALVYMKLAQAQNLSDTVSLRCAQIWLFNPLSIIISTRGNSDSLISLTVLLSAYFLLKEKPALAGFFLALSIHIRLYPIVFSLAMYLSLRSDLPSSPFTKRLSESVRALFPNKAQLVFAVSCVFWLILLTAACYHLYGMDFLRESILYHLTRKDTRHNFSVYFYLLYLEPNQPAFLMFLPQLTLILLLSLAYGRKSCLLFCLFTQAFVVVTYNPVLTSQYFIWYLSLLVPVHSRFNLSLAECSKLAGIWLFAQLAWLVPAYLLEFRGRNTFLFIWLQGIGFFCANLAVLVKLIKRFDVRGERKLEVKRE